MPLWPFADRLGDREVLLVESERALRRLPVHRQKLHLVLSGMRHLASEPGPHSCSPAPTGCGVRSARAHLTRRRRPRGPAAGR
ncbi:MAG: cryptochrome/photolyase family protein, partial [Pseudonocardia sp.]|nr:cryptochrome/photolyase family protein [Pseudonocardia sp.]